jgi:hypothetical protein
MAQAALMAIPYFQGFDNNGDPLAGGKVYFYTPGGTSTPKAIYSDSAESATLTNPVVLDSSGRASIWLDGYYYVVVTDSLGNIIKTQDNVSAAYSPAAPATVTFSEWQSQSDVLTYIGMTQFSVPGDKTAVYTVNRRIKATVTAGTITGNITVSSAGGSPIKTTVTVVWDLTEMLDSGLSAVWTGIISPVASGTPFQIPIGGIIDWYKSAAGVPALIGGWAECNGQTLSEPLSPLNGTVLPNLNGNAAGADTFSNSKIAPFTRGAATSGSYFADAIKAHQHATSGGSSSITVNAHTHSIAAGGSSTAAATNASHSHTLNVSSYNQAGTAGSGGGVSGLWQKGGSGLGETTSIDSQTPVITLTGHTDVESANTITGNTDNNGAATETIPKYVTVVKIMRIF